MYNGLVGVHNLYTADKTNTYQFVDIQSAVCIGV